MTTFALQIVTPDGIAYDGEATSLLLRTAAGDIQILARHEDYVGALSTGKAKIETPEGVKTASVSGGFVTVAGGAVRLVPTTFEFAEEIDLSRAEAAAERAKDAMEKKSGAELDVAKAKLARALTRISVKRGL